jgi:hypothetical protein
MIVRTVKPVHFEDFSGVEFERLVFAYHLRAGWTELAWYGQTGSDLGRDIVGIEPLADGTARRTVIQCVNRSILTLAKAVDDMTKVIGAQKDRPDAFKFVSRSSVSARRRDAIEQAAAALGIGRVTIWSSAEFEEQLRLRAEVLLERFLHGTAFPDSAIELQRFVDDFPSLADRDILDLMAAVFDRPAFTTPFQGESNLPAFQQAIEDTIGALNTGVWRTRDGMEIRRIPSLYAVKDPTTQATLRQVVREVDEIRRRFKQHLVEGGVRACGCGDPACPTFMVQPHAARDLDAARSSALSTFAKLLPGFAVRLH